MSERVRDVIVDGVRYFHAPDLARLEADVIRYREALEWYARGDRISSEFESDGGLRARAALAIVDALEAKP